MKLWLINFSLTAANTDTACNFLFYGRLAPSPITELQMRELEDEMQHPTGIKTVSRPVMEFDGIFISPQCGIAMEFTKVVGLRSVGRSSQKIYVSIHKLFPERITFGERPQRVHMSFSASCSTLTLIHLPDSGLSSFVYLALCILLVKQMELTRTPAGVSSVSRWVFVLQGVMDSFSFTSVRHDPLLPCPSTS